MYYKEMFLDYLNSNNVPHTNCSEHLLKITYNAKNMNNVEICIFFDKSDDAMAEIKCFKIINLKDNKMDGLLACNELNNHYRWVKFFIDDDGDVLCEADTLFGEDNCGFACENIMDRMADIVDSAYPQFAKIKFS